LELEKSSFNAGRR